MGGGDNVGAGENNPGSGAMQLFKHLILSLVSFLYHKCTFKSIRWTGMLFHTFKRQ